MARGRKQKSYHDARDRLYAVIERDFSRALADKLVPAIWDAIEEVAKDIARKESADE
jgi:hypothetical protein